MNYNALRYFYEVARARSLSKAARSLYVSQPALSRQIANLEADMKTPLFTRTNRSMELTRAGRILMRECASFFEKEQEIYRKTREAGSLEAGAIRIAFMGIGPAYKIATLLHPFQERFPDINIEYCRRSWSQLLQSVKSGEMDVGIKLRHISERYPDTIEHFTLQQARLAVILPTKHPLAGKKWLRVEQLRDEAFLLLSHEESSIPYNNTVRMCEEVGFTPQIVASYPNVETLLMMVQAGVGITILSPFAPLEGLTGVNCIPLKNAESINLDIIWRADNAGGAIRLFIEMAKEQWADSTYLTPLTSGHPE